MENNDEEIKNVLNQMQKENIEKIINEEKDNKKTTKKTMKKKIFKIVGTTAGVLLIGTPITMFSLIVGRQSLYAPPTGYVSRYEVEEFNEKFAKYEGIIKGSRIRSLIQDVNMSNNEEGQNHFITINTKQDNSTSNFNITTDNNTHKVTATGIVNTKNYKVEITKYTEDNYVSEITITENNENEGENNVY